jgi:hypothetical protein
MRPLKRLGLVALTLVLPTCGGSTANSTLIPQGVWGSIAVEMDVTASGATINFCCASGKIDPPLTVAPSGAFNLSGTYTRQGGPVPVGGFDPTPATYSGVINGNTMNLVVTAPPLQPETFTLTFGTHPTDQCVCPL